MNTAFTVISGLFVLSGFITALLILYSIFPHRKQPMKIMEAVWPLTGLWANWAGLWAYWHLGRQEKQKMKQDMGDMNMENMKDMDMKDMDMNMKDMPRRPLWQTVTLSTLHCGAGCTLADIIGEWATCLFPCSIGGSLLAGQWILDYVLALVVGIFFQYAAIRPMEQLSGMKTIVKAFKIDFFSLTSWQIGMYGWMAVVYFILYDQHALPKGSWEFWFMMQIAMFAGFITSFPTNWLLIKLGVKKGM